jgi:hypothetical protein
MDQIYMASFRSQQLFWAYYHMEWYRWADDTVTFALVHPSSTCSKRDRALHKLQGDTLMWKHEIYITTEVLQMIWSFHGNCMQVGQSHVSIWSEYPTFQRLSPLHYRGFLWWVLHSDTFNRDRGFPLSYSLLLGHQHPQTMGSHTEEPMTPTVTSDCLTLPSVPLGRPKRGGHHPPSNPAHYSLSNMCCDSQQHSPLYKHSARTWHLPHQPLMTEMETVSEISHTDSMLTQLIPREDLTAASALWSQFLHSLLPAAFTRPTTWVHSSSKELTWASIYIEFTSTVKDLSKSDRTFERSYLWNQ